MIDLVFWSFVVTAVPITLALGMKFLAIIVGPLGPPAASPLAWAREDSLAPHFASRRVGQMSGCGHGR